MKFLMVLLLVFSSSLVYGGDAEHKAILTNKILDPLIQLLRSGELNKASLPSYNKFRESKGRRPVTYEEVEPIFKASSQATESAYVEAFADEFSLEELKFLSSLFSTKIGISLMNSISQSITTGGPNKPDLSRITKKEQLEFERVASKNPDLAKNLWSRIEKVNAGAREKFSIYAKSRSDLKFPD